MLFRSLAGLPPVRTLQARIPPGAVAGSTVAWIHGSALVLDVGVPGQADQEDGSVIITCLCKEKEAAELRRREEQLRLITDSIPALVAWLFWRQREFFGIAVALFWLGTSLVDAGIYAADARDQILPLVSPWGGEDDVFAHDWTYMLTRFGKLSRDKIIGGRLRGAGMMLMPLALLAGVWVVSVLARGRGRARAAFSENARLEKLFK